MVEFVDSLYPWAGMASPEGVSELAGGVLGYVITELHGGKRSLVLVDLAKQIRCIDISVRAVHEKCPWPCSLPPNNPQAVRTGHLDLREASWQGVLHTKKELHVEQVQ